MVNADTIPATYPWLAGGISTLVFAIIIAVRLRDQKSKIKNYMLYTFCAITVAYFGWAISLWLISDLELYAYIFVGFDLVSHAALYSISLLFWELTMQKNYSKYTTLYRAVMAIITIIAYVLLSIRTVQAGFRFEDGALLYQFEGIGMLFYATLMIPAMLLGLKLSSLAFQAPNWRAKIRSLTVGLTILALAASIFYQYVYDFFFNNQLTGALDESVTYVFLAFLAVNIAVLIIDASHKKTDK